MPGVNVVQNLKVKFDFDRFSLMALNLEGETPVFFVLNITLNMHIYPQIAEWHWSSQGHVEATMRKGYSVVWRNIHVDKTLIWPNQYLWWEILNKYRDELEDQYFIFKRAEEKMQEKEDKMNQDEEKKAREKRYLRSREKQNEINLQTDLRNRQVLFLLGNH